MKKGFDLLIHIEYYENDCHENLGYNQYQKYWELTTISEYSTQTQNVESCIEVHKNRFIDKRDSNPHQKVEHLPSY